MEAGKIRKVIISVIVIGIAGGYLLYNAFKSSWVYYYTVDEFTKQISKTDNVQFKNSTTNQIVRLAGKIKTDSIKRNQMQLDFVLSGQMSNIPVSFQGIAPQNLEADKEVVVEGKVDPNGVFKANQILTRCESKYKAKLETKISE